MDQRALPLSASYTWGTSGTGAHVYIIDTGIRTTHEDFGGRATWAFSSVKGKDGSLNTDCHGHGTHVAGTAGGTRDGVAKEVQLYAVRVLDCSGSGTWSGVIAGIDSAMSAATDSTWDGTLAHSLTQGLLARLALHREQTARALALLERAQWERNPVPAVAEADDRFLRAELLHQLGRDEEAAGWYGSIADRSSHELVYLAPAQYRLGQISDRQRDHRGVLAYYRKLLDLWRDGEPDVPFLAEARRRVAELEVSLGE